MIRFKCPSCDGPLTAPDANAGETGRCTHCGELFDIPRPRGAGAGRPAAVLRLVCPGCDKTLGVPATAAGKPCTCPSCGTKFLVPDDAEPELAPALRSRSRSARDDDDDDRPRRPERRRRDEDDDEPVSRRRVADDEDDEEDERPSRRSRAKPKKRRKSRGGGGLPDWYRGPLGRLAENAVITLLLGLLALASPVLAGGLLTAWGFIIASVGAVWMLIVAAKEGVDQLLLNLFIPFYSLYYAITRWADVKQAVTLNLIGGAQYAVGVFLFILPLIAKAAQQQQQFR